MIRNVFAIRDEEGYFYDKFSYSQGIIEKYTKYFQAYGSKELAQEVLDVLRKYIPTPLHIEQIQK